MAAETEKQQPLDLDRYLSLILRRKWVIIFGTVPLLIAGIVYCLVATRVYKTSTTIVVVPQKVPENYVRSTVTGNVRERIRGIWQEVISRTTLERLIQQFNLYPDMREKYPMETVVELMRKKISIESPRTDRNNAFILSYEGTDPVLITKVCNSLANMFIEENLKLRESQAKSTAEFLAQQLEKVYKSLKEREEALKKYKMKHMGELPEQRDTNIAMMERLGQQMEGLQEDIRRAEDRKLLLQRELADEENNLRLAASTRLAKAAGHADGVRAPVTLESLKERLRDLRTRYTEQYPDVIATKQLIAKLEKEQAHRHAGQVNGTQAPGVSHEASSDEPPYQNAVVVGLRYQIKSLDMEIKAMKEENKKIKKQIEVYKKRIEDTPKREQELIDITRDYNNLRQTYNNLLTRKIEAEQAAALERRQEGEQFRVIDPARMPETPIKPNVKKVLLMTLILALGTGVGSALALEFISKAFYDPDEVTKALKLPMVACLPLVLTPDEKRKKFFKNIGLGLLAFSCYAGVGGLLFILWKKGAGSLAGLF